MKKMLFLIIMCLFVGQIWAQISQGARLVTGNIAGRYVSDIQNQLNGKYANQSFTGNLKMSYNFFTKNNFSQNVGFEVSSYTRNIKNSMNPWNNQFSTYNAVLFHYGYTKYFSLSPIHKQLFFALSPYVAPEFGFEHVTGFAANNNPSTKYILNDYALGLNVGIEPTLVFQLKERWLLSAHFGAARFQYKMEDLKNGNPTHHIDANLQFNPSAWGIGIGYFLAPKS